MKFIWYIGIMMLLVSQCYGKTPFRSCGEEEPCDKNFYCSMPIRFCSPCRDLCVEKFMEYCQHYCPGYLKDSKLANHPSLSKDTLIVLQALPISETPKSVLGPGMLPSTPVTRFIRRETSVTYQDYDIENNNNNEFYSRSLMFIFAAVIIACVLIGAYWLLKRKMQCCQQAKHAYVDNGCTRTSMEGTNGHWTSHTYSQHSYCELIDINTPKTLNSNANITMKSDGSFA